MERRNGLVILIRFGVTSIVIHKAEVKLIEIIPLPFLLSKLAVMAFPIG